MNMEVLNVEINKLELQDGTSIYGFKDDYITKTIEQSKNYYEIEVLELFSKYIPVESIICDIGANIGNHTLYFKKYFRPEHIYAFEPIKETFEVLEKNIKANYIKNITCFNQAIGKRVGKASPLYVKNNMGGTSIACSEEGDIEVVPLDDLKIIPPKFVKIDVEGYELEVIEGMKKILEQYSPTLWIEIFSANLYIINRTLNELGYELLERVENNCIYKKVTNETERLKLRKDAIFNILKYTDHTIATARKKYKDIWKSSNEYKEKLNNANLKYREVTSNYEKLKISSNNLKECVERLQEDKDKAIEMFNQQKNDYNILMDQKRKAEEKVIQQNTELVALAQELGVATAKAEGQLKEITYLEKQLLNLELKLEEQASKLKEPDTKLKGQTEELTEANELQQQQLEGKVSRLVHTENQIGQLEDIQQILVDTRLIETQKERNLLLVKVMDYLNSIEKLISEKDELVEKRKYLMERNEILYTNNQSLVDELSQLKAKYKVLSQSKLGKLTLQIWRLKKKIKSILKRG